MAEAPDLLRQRRDFHRKRVIVGNEHRRKLANDRLVVRDQPPFHAALLGAAENVECGAAQPAQPRQESERMDHPRPESALAQRAGRRIARRQQRRRQMIFEREIAFELPMQFLEKGTRASPEQPRARVLSAASIAAIELR